MPNETVVGNNYRIVILITFYIVSSSIFAMLFPVESKYGIHYGILIQIIFLSVFFIFSILSYALIFNKNEVILLQSTISSLYVIKIPLFLSLLGIAFILIDRIVYRGINPLVMSPALVRYMLNESEGGISSVFSLLGNILQCFVIIPSYYVISRRVCVRWFFFPSLVIISLFSSLLLGGRTPLLCFLVLNLGFLIMHHKLKVGFLIKFLMVFALFVAFSVSVFILRAEATGVDSGEYAVNLLRHLHFVPESISISAGNVFDDILNYTLVVFAYAFHPYSISSDAILNGSGKGNITFYAISFLLAKFFPIDLIALKHDYYEMFVSLPGGIYYDYGIIGVVGISFILVIINALSLYALCKSKGRSDTAKIMISMIICIFIFSPLLNAFNFVFFIFYLFVLVSYFFFLNFIGNKR
ncbi:O-antigen polymerase [Vibrio vulnificus]